MIAVFVLGFAHALSANPFDDINSYVQKGIACADDGNFDQAILEFNQAISLGWEYTDSRKGEILLAYVYYMRGHCFKAKKEFVSAADDYLRVLYFMPRKGLEKKMALEADHLINKAVDGLESLPRKMAEKRRDIFAKKMEDLSKIKKRERRLNGKGANEDPVIHSDKKEGKYKPDTSENEEDEWDF